MTNSMAEPTWDVASRVALRNERAVFVSSQRAAWYLAMIARRRRNADVMAVPGLGYLISGAAAMREYVLDKEHFVKDGPASSGALVTQVMGPYALLNMEGPDHVALRRKLQDLFTPKYVAHITEHVLGDQVVTLRERLHAGEAVDVARFARILTGSMICHMNGLDLEGEALEQRALDMYDTGTELAYMMPLRMKQLPESKLGAAKALFHRMIVGIDAAWDEARPDTIAGRLRDLGTTHDEARGVIGALMVAGTETTTTAIVRIVGLMCDSGQWGRLQADPELLEPALDEGMRFSTPLPAVTRTVAKDVDFHGVRMRENRLVLGLMYNAMRDPRVIEDGFTFDIGRKLPRELRMLWFGAGPHFCIGSSLARRELSMVVEAIASLDEDIVVVDRERGSRVLLPTYQRLVVQRRSFAERAGAV